MVSTYNLLCPVVFGAGSLEKLGEKIQEFKGKKVFCIYDQGVKMAGIAKKVTNVLEKNNIPFDVFEDVKPDPADTIIDDIAKEARESGADIVVGIGGGSSLDAAKSVAGLLTNPGRISEYYMEDGKGFPTPTAPMILIPTAAGTGSEVTWCAVITDTARMYKMTVGDPIHMIPTLSICDPTITLDLPQSLTASCGVDALTHCIEAYTVKVHQPITDALALKGISLIAQNLEKAYENGHDKDARRNMMIASTIGGMSFISSNVGAVHAFAETVGAWFDTPHGVANSLFLPYIMEYNIPACMDRFIDIAQALGIERNGMNDQEYAYSAVQYVKDLNRRLNIPTIKEIKGITEDKFDAIAQRSADNILSNDNAREIHKEDYLELLKKAYKDEGEKENA